MTIGQLREALAQIGAGHDNTEVQVWLPGSYIKLNDSLWLSGKGTFLIEGNVTPGSALAAKAEGR